MSPVIYAAAEHRVPESARHWKSLWKSLLEILEIPRHWKSRGEDFDLDALE